MSRESWEVESEPTASPRWIFLFLVIAGLAMIAWFMLNNFGTPNAVMLSVTDKATRSQFYQSATEATIAQVVADSGAAEFDIHKSVTLLSEQGFLGMLDSEELVPQIRGSLGSWPGTNSNSLIIGFTVSGVVIDREAKLLASDFRIAGPGLPGQGVHQLEDLFEFLDKIGELDVDHLVVLLEVGQTAVDRRLGIESNDFAQKLSDAWRARPYPKETAKDTKLSKERIWFLCSNDANQITGVDLRSRHGIFSESCLLALLGKADVVQQDDNVSMREFFTYVYGRCSLLSRNTIGPVLIGHQGIVEPESADKESLDFFVSRVTWFPSSDEKKPEEDPAETPDEVSKPKPEEPIRILAEDFEDLYRDWEIINDAQDFNSPDWIEIDYAPHIVRLAASELLFAQGEALSGRGVRSKNASASDELRSAKSRLREQLISTTAVLTEAYRLQRRKTYRAIYIANDLALLHDKLKTFNVEQERDLANALEDTLDSITRLVDAIVLNGESLSEADLGRFGEELARLNQEEFPRLADNAAELSGKFGANCPGIVRCLLECANLPIDVRASLYSKIAASPRSIADSLEAEDIETTEAFLKFAGSNLSKPKKGLSPGSLSQYLADQVAGELPNYDPSNLMQALRETSIEPQAVNANALRLVDGRDDVASLPTELELLFYMPGRADANLDIAGGNYPVILKDINETVRIPLEVSATHSLNLLLASQMSENALSAKLVRVKTVDGKESKPASILKNFDPSGGDQIFLELKGLEYSNSNRGNTQLKIELQDPASSGEVASQRVSVTLPKVPDLELRVGDIAFSRNDQARNLEPFPNDTGLFDIFVTHRSNIEQDFQLEIFSIDRTPISDWPEFKFDERVIGAVSQGGITTRPKKLGTWRSSKAGSGQRAKFSPVSAAKPSEQGNPPADATNTPAADFIDIGQGLLLVLSQPEKSNKKWRFWLGFDIQHPSEYLVDPGRPRVTQGTASLDLETQPGRDLPSGNLEVRMFNASQYGRPDTESFVTISSVDPQVSPRVRATQGDWLAVDVAGYPRVFSWNRNSRGGPSYIGLKSIRLGEPKPEQFVWRRLGNSNSVDPIVVDGRELKEIQVTTAFDFPEDYAGERVIVQFEQQDPMTLVGDRQEEVSVKFDEVDKLLLQVRTKVGDHVRRIPIRGTSNRSLLFRMSDGQQEIPFRFDMDDPRLKIEPQKIARPIELGRPFEFSLVATDSNLKALLVEIKHADDKAWTTIRRLEFNSGASRRSVRVSSSDLAGTLRVGVYSVRAAVEDHIGRKAEVPAIDGFVQIVPKKKQTEKKPWTPPTPPPKPPTGIVKIVPKRAINSARPISNPKMVVWKFTPASGDDAQTQNGQLEYAVKSAGTLEVKVVQRFGPQYLEGERTIQIAKQEDIKAYEIIVNKPLSGQPK